VSELCFLSFNLWAGSIYAIFIGLETLNLYSFFYLLINLPVIDDNLLDEY